MIVAAGDIDARVGAVARLGHGLARVGREVPEAFAEVRQQINAVGAAFATALVRDERELRLAMQEVGEAEALLAGCREGCGPLIEQARRARAAADATRLRLARDRAAEQRFQRAAHEALSAARQAEASIMPAVTTGRATVGEHVGLLNSYLAQRER